MMKLWKEFVYYRVRRDQMSLFYCSWKLNTPIKRFKYENRKKYVKFYGGKWSIVRGVHKPKRFD